MATLRLFQSEGRQAVRLPEEFEFHGEEIEIFRRGDEVVLREKQSDAARVFELITSLSDDFLDERNDTPPQERAGL
jgi:antitoxin VapB